MATPSRRQLAVLCWAASACTGVTASPTWVETVEASCEQQGVPSQLVWAVASVEGGLVLPAQRVADPNDHVPVAGILELRHGAFDSLARGAALMGTTEDALRQDTLLGTRAGIAVLAELGRQTGAQVGELSTWHAALASLSGHRTAAQREDYARRVFGVLATGTSLPTASGETVTIHRHVFPAPDFSPPVVTAQGLTPEFPGATWFDTPQANKWTPGRTGIAVDRIVIHDTEGGWDASVATLQNDSGKSVQYIIDADGSRVGQFVLEADTAWHAGDWYWNQRSVGIEHVGYASMTFQRALYLKSVQLVNSIRSRHTIPLDRQHIAGHYQVPGPNPPQDPACSAGLDACESDTNYGGSNHHTDPGYNWQWCEYMEMLGGTCECNDAWALYNCTTDHTEAWRCNNGTLEKQVCTGGCTVMPLGVPDVCNTGAASGSSSAAPASSRAAASSSSASRGSSSEAVQSSSFAGASSEGAVSGGSSVEVVPPTSDDPPKRNGFLPGCHCNATGEAPMGVLWLGALATLGLRRRARR